MGDTIRPQEVIRVPARGKVEYLLFVYSIQLTRESAQMATTFAIGPDNAFPDVSKVLQAAPRVPLDFPTLDTYRHVQVAIWAVVDNLTRSELITSYPVITDIHIGQARELLQRAGFNPNSFRLFSP
jgi:hypothetical protein